MKYQFHTQIKFKFGLEDFTICCLSMCSYIMLLYFIIFLSRIKWPFGFDCRKNKTYQHSPVLVPGNRFHGLHDRGNTCVFLILPRWKVLYKVDLGMDKAAAVYLIMPLLLKGTLTTSFMLISLFLSTIFLLQTDVHRIAFTLHRFVCAFP